MARGVIELPQIHYWRGDFIFASPEIRKVGSHVYKLGTMNLTFKYTDKFSNTISHGNSRIEERTVCGRSFQV